MQMFCMKIINDLYKKCARERHRNEIKKIEKLYKSIWQFVHRLSYILIFQTFV